jgi:hypothetical protein
MNSRLYADEELVMEGMANLQRGWEAVGGRLYLTNHRLIFEAHAINIQNQATDIPLTRIHKVEKCWSEIFGLIPLVPNSIAVETTDGVSFRFVAWGRQEWIDAIEMNAAMARKQTRDRRPETSDRKRGGTGIEERARMPETRDKKRGDTGIEERD